MMPRICGSATILPAPPAPPSGVHIESSGSPKSTARPRTVGMSPTASSTPRRAAAPREGATVIDSSDRICADSPRRIVTAPSGPGSKLDGPVAFVARTRENGQRDDKSASGFTLAWFSIEAPSP